MEVILLEKSKLGLLGDKVNVKPGFARNFLIPQGKALPATGSNIVYFEARRAELEQEAQERVNKATQRAQTLEGLRIVIPVQAGEEGRLFGSVTSQDIVRAITEAGHKVIRSEVLLPTGPIRQVGEHDINLNLHGSDIVAKVTLSVVAKA